MKYAKMSAIDLQREIDRAEHYSEDSGSELFEALKEIKRLRMVCIDIIDLIGTEYATFGNADVVLDKVDDIAHKYWIPK